MLAGIFRLRLVAALVASVFAVVMRRHAIYLYGHLNNRVRRPTFPCALFTELPGRCALASSHATEHSKITERSVLARTA